MEENIVWHFSNQFWRGRRIGRQVCFIVNADDVRACPELEGQELCWITDSESGAYCEAIAA